MKFNSALAASAMAALCVLGAAPDAKALVWDLSNVPLTDGGVLNGSFEINQYGYVYIYSLQTTGGTLASLDATYSSGFNTMATGAPNTTSVEFFSAAGRYKDPLVLTFQNSLNTPGIDPIVGGFGGPSWECDGWSCPTGLIRFVGEGAEAVDAPTPTPLPATWTMMMIGFAGLAGFAAFGRRTGVRFGAV